jgi:hypothetical protein
MIAPQHLLFYDAEWKPRGSKQSLESQLEKIIGISHHVLRERTAFYGMPFALRMSWVASRKTTRVEDTAYCLLGLFNVNMPLFV